MLRRLGRRKATGVFEKIAERQPENMDQLKEEGK